LLAAPVALTRPALATPSAVIYTASSRICHQRPERSFSLAGTQLPVCARCFGLYFAGALGAVTALAMRRRLSLPFRGVLAVAAIPTAVTWGAEVAGLMPFSNTARAVAALPLGLVGGWVFVQLLRYDDPLLDGHQIDHRRSHVSGG
jgi:uncharacterized membrane protein